MAGLGCDGVPRSLTPLRLRLVQVGVGVVTDAANLAEWCGLGPLIGGGSGGGWRGQEHVAAAACGSGDGGIPLESIVGGLTELKTAPELLADRRARTALVGPGGPVTPAGSAAGT